MSQTDLDELATQLRKAHVTTDSPVDGGVSFENKQLKLDTEDDAKEVVEAIRKCDNLQYLHLGGNTLGVDAAKAISKALQSHRELKRALWMDMFTGRMKTEIPKALNFLGAGLALSGAQLVELDLSDNAFGPIGMQGLAALLQSSTCYTLQVLKLNNNGLGITGGKLLSRALLNCHASSKEAGRVLGLQVFVAGRNRLENEGATALAEVFQAMGTLEEVSMPQNGIWHKGISALCEAFAANPGLRVINLNDNTVREKGAASMARALPGLQKLSCLNLGDCLVKTRGAMLLADALANGHPDLQEVNLGFNEISAKGGLALVKAMGNKSKLEVLDIGGNHFGKSGCESVASELVQSGQRNALASLSEDEGDSEEEDESEDDGTNDDDEEEDSNNESRNNSKFDNSLDMTSPPKATPPTTLNIPRVPGMSEEDSPKSAIPQVRKLIEEDSPKNADIPHVPKLLHVSSEFAGGSCLGPGQLLLPPKSATLLCSRSSFRDGAPAVTSPKSCTYLHTSQTSPLALVSSRSPSTLFRDMPAEFASNGRPSLPLGTNTLEGSKLTAVEGPGDGDAPRFSELTQDGVRATVGEFLKNPTGENFLNLGSDRTKLLLDEVKSCWNDEYLVRVMPLLMKVSGLSVSSEASIRKPALECTKALYQEIFRWGQEMGQSVPLLNTLLVHLGLLKTDDKTFARTWNIEGCISALEHVVQQNCLPSSAKETVVLFLKRQTSRQTNNQGAVLTPVTIT